MATPSHTGPRAIEAEAANHVRAAGIRKRFGAGGYAALGGVDLDVRQGELLALLGPSGSGKTTLLRVIAGLEIPDQGRVFFGSEDVTDKPVQQRGIGFVFQHYALFRHLSVFDNVAYGLRARRPRPGAGAIRKRVDELLELVQLGEHGGRFPSQLSGGQRQRVALARALAPEPNVLLLDEPFGALDAQVRKDLRRWLRDIHHRTGQTTIFVTHDQDEALELADRVAILNRGRLEQVGSPDDVYEDPASAFVMGFVGESVRLPVRIEGGTARFGGRALPLVASGQPDGDADLFLRLGDLALADVASGEITGEVRGVRRVGRVRRADVRLDVDGRDVEVDLSDEMPAVADRVSLVVTGGRFFARRAPHAEA